MFFLRQQVKLPLVVELNGLSSVQFTRKPPRNAAVETLTAKVFSVSCNQIIKILVTVTSNKCPISPRAASPPEKLPLIKTGVISSPG